MCACVEDQIKYSYIFTLYSCVPGGRLFILDPSWTNMCVMVAMREWRSLYSSYSAQKSSWYLWRCSKPVMGPYVLKGDRDDDDAPVTCHLNHYAQMPSDIFSSNLDHTLCIALLFDTRWQHTAACRNVMFLSVPTLHHWTQMFIHFFGRTW